MGFLGVVFRGRFIGNISKVHYKGAVLKGVKAVVVLLEAAIEEINLKNAPNAAPFVKSTFYKDLLSPPH